MNIDYNQYLMLHGSLLYEVKIRHLWHPEKKPRITQIDTDWKYIIVVNA